MYINKKVKFNYESNYLDSIYVFEDGDFILFGATDNSFENESKNSERKSTLYDGKTLKPKLILKVSSLCSFFNLSNNEFALCTNFSSFTLFKFNSDRTSFNSIQEFSEKEGGSAKALNQMPNGDICINRLYVGYNGIFIYRKKESNPQYAPYGENFLYHLEDVDDLISLNDKEVLGYKVYKGIESLVLKVFNIDEYKVIRKNEIKFQEENSQKRLYISFPFYKVNKNKLITASTKCLYIFGIDTLELETTILLEKFIEQILIRPKNNIFLLCKSRQEKCYLEVRNSESVCFYHPQYIINLKIDFEINELIESKEEDISKHCGKNKELFHIYNDINNGIITLTDKSKVIFYEDCDD